MSGPAVIRAMVPRLCLGYVFPYNSIARLPCVGLLHADVTESKVTHRDLPTLGIIQESTWLHVNEKNLVGGDISPLVISFSCPSHSIQSCSTG